MFYRKLFLLIAFAPLGLLLFVRDAQPWDEDTSPWGFIDWFDGSRVRCLLGFGDTTLEALEAEPDNGTLTTSATLTIRISLKPGKTITCDKIPSPGENGVTQSGQAILVQGIGSKDPGALLITGIKEKECSNLYPVGSAQIFEAKCGKNGADVTATILWVTGPLADSFYQVGGSRFETEDCSSLFPPFGAFDSKVIFLNVKSFNAKFCEGEGNHGPTHFRGCSAVDLNTLSQCTDALHTGGTSAEGLHQSTVVGLECRESFNDKCKSDPNGVIQAEIDCTTIDCTQIIEESLTCGEPDNPEKVLAQDVHKSGHKLKVKCPRCFNSAPVFSADGVLVVAGLKSDGPTFAQEFAGLCVGKVVPKK